MKQRIWELDAFRGFCVLGMIVVHFIYDLTALYRIVKWEAPALFSFVQNWGGVLFLLLSGVCATLGSRSFRRGLIVYGCGLLCTAVTAGMVVLGFANESIIVRFGVLHCLGLCMILWSLLRRLPTRILALLGSLMVITGLLICDTVVEVTWLYPLGLTAANFFSSDYFPLLPHLGFFLLGSVLGRALYRNKQSLLPGMDQKSSVLRFLCFCGRQSLLIYLLHQPVLTAVCEVITLLK